MNPKVIVFDFDGVIVAHSEFFKEDAWEIVFDEYKGKYEKFFEEAKGMFGFGKKGDRFDILRYVLTKMDVEGVEDEVQAGAKVFDEYVQKNILEAGMPEGAGRILSELSSQYPLYINTGTTQEGIEKSVINLGIEKYFKGVYGGPASKAENMREIALVENVETEDLLLVGDSNGDVSAAEETKSMFIGVTNKWNRWDTEDKLFPTISHIKEIEALL